MIGIVDYGMGNLRSVFKALDYLGFEATIITEPSSVEDCTHVILPGVGAYAVAMENLRALGLASALFKAAEARKPLLGICLGMQMLSTSGSEPWPSEGLDLIHGETIPLNVEPTTHLPHVGWNTVRLRMNHPIFSGVRRDVDVYFVHSYQLAPYSEDNILCTTDYDVTFVSGVAKGSVVGLQFHPEKSQNAGMQILRNFCSWDGLC